MRRLPFAHPSLTLAHPGLPWLTLLARCECLKRHGVGEREGELRADFTSNCAAKTLQGALSASPHHSEKACNLHHLIILLSMAHITDFLRLGWQPLIPHE